MMERGAEIETKVSRGSWNVARDGSIAGDWIRAQVFGVEKDNSLLLGQNCWSWSIQSWLVVLILLSCRGEQPTHFVPNELEKPSFRLGFGAAPLTSHNRDIKATYNARRHRSTATALLVPNPVFRIPN